MKFFKSALVTFISLPLLFMISIAGWRVDFFHILDEKHNIVFSSPAALGHKFITRYIHSVELTPVEDEYHIIGGRLWAWEERVRSTNAGLPFSAPVQGRFIEKDDWMIFQGGRVSWSTYYYRIGNKDLGLNQASFEPFGRKNFYEIFPGERLIVSIKRDPFMFGRIKWAPNLIDSPVGVPAIESFTRQ